MKNGLAVWVRCRGWQFLYVSFVGLGLFFAFSHRVYDDPFITYRYAESIRRGLGFVYNPGERVLSTTAPLFALLLAALGGLWPYLPALANLIGAISVAAGGLLFWDLGQSWKTPLVGWAGLLLYPTFPLLLSTLGSETPLYLTLIFALYALYARQKVGWMTVFGALAILVRADAVIPVALVGMHYLWVHRTRFRESTFWRTQPWGWFALSAGILLAWHAFAWLYFGNPLPVTLAAKQAQGRMAISQGFAPGFLRIVTWYQHNRYYQLELGLALLGTFFALLQLRSRPSLPNRIQPRAHQPAQWTNWLLFLAWPVAYFLAYTLLGVTRYFWYYAPLVPGWVAATGLGIVTISGLLSAGKPHPVLHRTAALLPPVLLTVLLIGQGSDILKLSHTNDRRYPVYRAVGEYLAENTPSDARIGALEIGIIGYFSQRPMVDFAGLLQPEVAGQMTPEATYDATAIWAVQTYHPDYLVLIDGTLPRLEQKIAGRCYTVARFATISGASPNMRILACGW